MSEEKKSFWVTLPGVLTGIAGLITAVTALYLALTPAERSVQTSAISEGGVEAPVVSETRSENAPEVTKPVPPRSEGSGSNRLLIEQQDATAKAKQVEEERQRLQESARLAKSEAEAEAAIREFALRHRVLLDPSPAQRRTLAALLAENVRAEKIEAYLLLMHAGVGLVFSEWAGSLRRIELILDAAAQIAEGGNVGRTIQGKTPKERITSLAELIQATPIATDPRVADQQVQDLRRKALKYPSIVLR